MTKKILCVDDDLNILQAHKRQLRGQFKIETTTRAESGLQMIQNEGPYAVIVSDLRMPGMNGIKFLAEVRKRTPDTVRMLFSGQADFDDAIAVVNEGHIFRFLTKPCPTDTFARALKDGLEQYRLISSERELLDKTLKGSIKLLTDILSLVNPEAFGRSVRMRQTVNKIAARLNLKNAWQADLAVLLAQIGCVTLPPEIVKKKYAHERLSAAEDEMFWKHPQIGRDLLANIPRLEAVAEAIASQEKCFDGSGSPRDLKKGKDIPVIARLLKVVHDFDDFVHRGKSPEQALTQMRHHRSWYDPHILAELDAEVLEADKGFVVREIQARQISTGMILASNLRTKSDLLLVAKRHEISDTLRACILNYAEKGNIVEPIKILERK